MSDKTGRIRNIPSGLLLIHKKPGITSFDALGEIKRALGIGKVGHTGTLDKFAQGLLLVLTGRALKLSPWFSRCGKEYEAGIRFGIETDTLDPEGAVVAEAPLPSREAVEKALPAFRGGILQAPPEYSAIHINGKRASALARSGESAEMQKRPVSIYKLELLSWEPPFARIFVHCSSGTYIRSLARDIARASGSRAHLAALTRTKIAGFALEDAQEGPFFIPKPITKSVFKYIGLPFIDIEPHIVQNIIHGKPISRILDDEKLSVFSSSAAGIFSDDSFIAMIEKKDGAWKYGYVYG